MLKPEIKQQWVEALRSGEYKQGKGALRLIGKEQDSFCCLGVLCDKSNVGEWRVRENSYKAYRYYDNTERYGFGNPPTGVITSALEDNAEDFLISNLKDPEGFMKAVRRYEPACEPSFRVFGCLVTMNDNGVSFTEIADVIEQYL